MGRPDRGRSRLCSDGIPCATVRRQPLVRSSEIGAVIFDMDGVVTDTAVGARGRVEATLRRVPPIASRTGSRVQTVRCRRRLSPVRRRQAPLRRRAQLPHVAKHRATAGRSHRSARPGHHLRPRQPQGSLLPHAIREEPALAYPSTIQAVRDLAARGVRTAIISASRNMSEVLESAGLSELFEVRVDGVIADERRLPGKPNPAVFLEAARRWGLHRSAPRWWRTP